MASQPDADPRLQRPRRRRRGAPTPSRRWPPVPSTSWPSRGPTTPGSLEDYAEQLRKRLRVAARIRVITHPRGRLRSGQAVPAPVGAARRCRRPLRGARAAPVVSHEIGGQAGHQADRDRRLDRRAAGAAHPAAVAARRPRPGRPGRAAHGGRLHPRPGLLARPAGARCPWWSGGSGRRLAPGTITVAPSGVNLLVQDVRMRVVCVPPDPGSSTSPASTSASRASPTRWARTRSACCSPAWAGTVLPGCKQMRDRGATTLGQDEATSTVYGMPQAAHALDAVDTQLPIERDGAGHARAGGAAVKVKLTDRAVRRAARAAVPGRRAGLRREPPRSRMAYSVAERLRESGAADVTAYLAMLDDPAERQRLLDEVTIQETHFFRNPPQVRALRKHVLPGADRARRHRTAAGCASGARAARPARSPTASR